MTPRTPSSVPQGLVAERYRLESELGRGGTAVVYRASDTLLGVPRAIKFLERNFVKTTLKDRLWNEARAMARLSNPHLLQIYDIGSHDGVDYVVMDLAVGGSLEDWLTAHGPMPAATAVAFTIQLLCALDTAHQAGIVHRDVKPGNVLLDQAGVAMLADFGIALVTEEDLYRHTRAGVMMGSLAFMAPEQRQDARSVNMLADIYATGATLYQLLTAQLPMDLFTAGPSSNRWDGIPDELVAVIRKAVELSPEDRFGSAREMALRLAALPLGDPTGPVIPSASATAAAIQSLSDTTQLLQRPEPTQKTGQTLVADELMGGETTTPPPVAMDFSAPLPEDSDLQQPTILPFEDSDSSGVPVWLVALAILLLVGGGVGAWMLREPVSEGTGAMVADALVEEPVTPASGEVGPGAEPAVGAATADAEPVDEPAAEEPPVEDGVAAEDVAPAEEPAVEEPSAEAPAVEAAPAEDESAAPVVEEPATPAGEPATEEPAAEKPADAVADADVPPEAAPDPVDSGAVAGSWKGVFNGRQATMTLRQSGDTVSGTMEVRFMSNVSTHTLSGRYNADTRTLVLSDNDGSSADSGTYTATLTSDGGKLDGNFRTNTGNRQVLFAMRRS